MERTLYHGSEFIIQKPEFLKGNIHNDYGIGFYCTTNKELAKEWAAKRSGKGYVNKYILRDDRLRILDLTKPPFQDVLHWVSLLMHNRESAEYNDYINDAISDLEKSVEIALNAGIPDDKIVLDPGIGFAKDLSQNLIMMNNLEKPPYQFL